MGNLAGKSENSNSLERKIAIFEECIEVIFRGFLKNSKFFEEKVGILLTKDLEFDMMKIAILQLENRDFWAEK